MDRIVKIHFSLSKITSHIFFKQQREKQQQQQTIKIFQQKYFFGMEGLYYESRLTYTYKKGQEEMNKILNFDYFQKYQFRDEYKIVEYIIDHSNCVKLSDLLYWIESKFIRLHLYQIIQLCVELIKKLEELKVNSINHNYLSSDRIWLQLKPGSEKFRIIYSELYYSIHFTGYDCPFYEREDYQTYQIYDPNAIQEIIKQILQIVEKSFRNKVIERANKKNIFNLLKNAINTSLDEFQYQATDIIQKYKNISEQRLEHIDRHFVRETTINRRGRRIENVRNNILSITKQYYSPNEWQIYERIFYQFVPLLVKEIKDLKQYKEVKLPSQLQISNFNNQLVIQNDYIDDMIKKCTDKAQAQFKLELEKEIKLQVLSQVSNIKQLLNYFYNNVEFRVTHDKKIISDQIISIKQQKLEEFVKMTFQQICEREIRKYLLELI